MALGILHSPEAPAPSLTRHPSHIEDEPDRDIVAFGGGFHAVGKDPGQKIGKAIGEGLFLEEEALLDADIGQVELHALIGDADDEIDIETETPEVPQ